MLKYRHAFIVGLQSNLVYRWNFAARSLFSLFHLAFVFIFWGAIYAGKTEIGGFGFAQTLTYFLVLFLLQFFIGAFNEDYQISEDIRNGLINQFLLKPINYFAYRLSVFAAARVVSGALGFMALLVALPFFRGYLALPHDAWRIALGLPAMALTGLIQFSIAYCFGMLAFWFLEIQGFVILSMAVETVLGGQFFPLDLGDEDLDRDTVDRNVLTDRIVEEAMTRYKAREDSLGTELMEALERFLLLQTIDERWREHLFDMDYLREGIHLRGFAQIDPLVAYKNEAFVLFGDLMNSVWSDYARMIYNVQVSVDGPPTQNGGGQGGAPIAPFSAAGNSTRAGRVSYSGGHSAAGSGALAAAAAAAGLGSNASAEAAFGEDGGEMEALPVVEQRVLDDEHQVGRNDPCWCGSGKKFKKCHGA